MEESAIEIAHTAVHIIALLWEEMGLVGLLVLLAVLGIGILIIWGLSKLSTIIREAADNSKRHRRLLKTMGFAADGVRGIILASLAYSFVAAILGVASAITIAVSIGALSLGFGLTRTAFSNEFTWVKRSGALLLVGCGMALLCYWTWWLLEKSATFSTADLHFTMPPLELFPGHSSPLERSSQPSFFQQQEEIYSHQRWLTGCAVVAFLVGLWNGYKEARPP